MAPMLHVRFARSAVRCRELPHFRICPGTRHGKAFPFLSDSTSLEGSVSKTWSTSAASSQSSAVIFILARLALDAETASKSSSFLTTSLRHLHRKAMTEPRNAEKSPPVPCSSMQGWLQFRAWCRPPHGYCHRLLCISAGHQTEPEQWTSHLWQLLCKRQMVHTRRRRSRRSTGTRTGWDCLGRSSGPAWRPPSQRVLYLESSAASSFALRLPRELRKMFQKRPCLPHRCQWCSGLHRRGSKASQYPSCRQDNQHGAKGRCCWWLRR